MRIGILLLALCATAPRAFAVNLQQLEPAEIETLKGTMQTLEPLITAKKQNGTANVLTWQELYEPLSLAQRAFLDAMRGIKAETLGSTSHHFGEPSAEDQASLTPVGVESVMKNGTATPLDPQYLPAPVLTAYQQMMQTMQAELGKRLFVESGYRSPAYQLYLFLFYMPKHGHSITETNKFVALPGYSEHGNPHRQAIDFINAEGINGEDHPEEFEALPEYRWLQQHAAAHGFVLSYPRDNAYHTSFEPWHWHYENRDK